MHALGSSSRLTLSVTVGRKRADLQVRPNLFGSDLAVVVGPPEYRGLFLVPRWEELIRLITHQSSRRAYRYRPEDLRYQAVGSIYHAIRQVEHVLTSYGLVLDHGEKSLMLRARQAALHANQIALGLRSVTVGETAEDLKVVAGEILHELGEPRNLPKREGKQYLSDLLSARDIRGRANATVVMVRAIAASERFRERLEDGIMRIEPVVIARQKTLLNLHELAWFVIDMALDFVTHLVQQLETRRQRFYENELTVARAQHRLRQHATELLRVDVHPFLVPLGFVVDEFREAALKLPKHPEAAVALLLRSRESLRLAEIHVELQRFIFVLTRIQLGIRPVPKAGELEGRRVALRKRFAAINDEGFRFPVRGQVLALLDQASEPLAVPTRESCEIARGFLKQAGDVLGRLPTI